MNIAILKKYDLKSFSKSSDLVGVFALAVIRHRVPILLLTLLTCAIFGAGIAFLQYNHDSRVFLGSDNPQRLALEKIENTYTPANSVQFIVAPEDGTIFDRRILMLLGELTDTAWGVPHAFSVSSISNYQRTEVDGDTIEVATLYDDPLLLNEKDLSEIRDRALSSSDLVNRTVSEDGSVASVSVLVQIPDEKAQKAIIDIAAYARQTAIQLEAAFPGVEIRLSGGIMGDVAFAEAARRDSQTLIPLMFVVIAITLTIGLRSLAGMAATLMLIGLSTAVAMGIGGYAGLSINAATSGAPVIIMTLAIADSVHLLTTISQLRRSGLDARDSIIESLRINLAPIAITSLTTAIGFLSLNFSESPPLRELGTLVAIGSVAACVLSVTFLPALASYLPYSIAYAPASRTRLMRALADTVLANRRPIFWTSIVLIPLVSLGILRIVIDDDYVRYFDDSFAFRRDTEFMEKRLTGLHVIQFSVPSGQSQGVTGPDYLRQLDSFADWLGNQDKVKSVFALSRSMKRINRILNGDDPQFEKIPDNRKLAAQYLIFLEMSLPPGVDLGNMIDVDRSQTLVTARLSNATSADVKNLATTSEKWLEDNVPDIATEAAGMSVAYGFITERNIRSMLNGTLVALVSLSFVLFFYLRDLRIGLISLIPNLIPIAMAFGLWGYFKGNVNLAVSVVAAMTLGIVVDDTVHFLSKYMRGRKASPESDEEAIRITFNLVGPALIMTSITLFLGFAVLSTSGFAVSSQAGMMSAITIAIALIADLLFLPALLLRFGGKRS